MARKKKNHRPKAAGLQKAERLKKEKTGKNRTEKNKTVKNKTEKNKSVKNKTGKKEIALGFAEKAGKDHVGAYAAQAAYFLVLSFIPFVLFLTTMIRYTDLTYNMLSEALRSMVPHTLQAVVMEVVSEVYNRNTAIVPISLLLAIWSAGKAMQSLIVGLNTIYHVKETRNWLINRINAVFYTMLFGVAIISSFIMLVVGNRLQMAISQMIPGLGWLMRLMNLTGSRTLLVCAALFVIFTFLYHALPNRSSSFKSQMPGAAIIAVAWTIFSNLLSLYFELFPAMNNMYGSLTALIFIMIWLYFCMSFVLFGAEINDYFENQFRKAHETVIERLNLKTEGTEHESVVDRMLPEIIIEEPVDSEDDDGFTEKLTKL